MVMTPFKLRPRFPRSSNRSCGLSDNSSASEFEDEPMVSSPARGGGGGGGLFMSASPSSSNNNNNNNSSKDQQLPSANLFGDTVPSTTETTTTTTMTTPTKKLQCRRFMSRSKDHKRGDHHHDSTASSSSSSILRPLDLNAEATSSMTPVAARQRKRTSDTATNVPAGREDVAYEDSDEDMFSSPVKQQQQQQHNQQQQYKASPHCYRTLDGRTVMSKNPFSPFTPMDTTTCTGTSTTPAADEYQYNSHPHNMGTAPTMPESFYPSSTTAAAAASRPSSATAAPMITLMQRSPSITGQGAAACQQQQKSYFQPSQSGFPDQQGRYSFTGSPIEEVDASLFINHAAQQQQQYGSNNNNKIRRLQEANDVATRPKLQVRTTHSTTEGSSQKNPYRWQQQQGGNDNISPSDVMSFFPAAPPTPVKRERNGGSYTPLRISSETTTQPSTPPRRARCNSHDLFLPLASDMTNNAQQQQGNNNIPESRFHTDFDVIGQLGNGSFGTVYKCLSRLDGCMYAVKAAKRKAKGQADRDRMLKEVYALAALSDQADTAAFHIVRYHQAWMEENRLYIQTELCSCTLQTEIQRGTLSSIPRRFKLLRELSVALEFIHRHGMVHLDIKPENIFVKNDQYKLGDFGLVSKSVTPSGDDVEEGDSRYMSMELLSGEFKDLTKSDIFSMGATMYEICLGRELPMDGQEWQDIRSGSLQPLTTCNPKTPFAMELIIKEMMHPNPAVRPHASQLLKKNELLSDEQKQLLAEKQKVFRVNMALALQTERMKKLTPPRAGGLMRANTWNGSLPKWL